MTRVLHWICDAPSPYNSFLFRTLAATPGIDLLVHFRRLGVSSHPWAESLLHGFESREMTAAMPDASLLRVALSPRGAALMIGGWYDLTLRTLLTVSRAPFAIWTDTPDHTTGRPAAKGALRAGWLRFVLPRATRVFGTGTVALDVLADMGAPRARLTNFPYWIDLDLFAPGPVRDPRAALTVVSSGRLAPQKGYDTGLRALAAAFRAKAVPFRWLVAGTGPDEVALKALATELGIAPQVEWLGWTEPADLPALYRSADLFLHPARWEPYGVVVLEAMASGVPVLASRQTNAALDRVIDGTSGLLHDVNDVAQLAAQLSRCAGDRVALRAMGTAAHATAHQWPVGRAVHIISDFLASLD